MAGQELVQDDADRIDIAPRRVQQIVQGYRDRAGIAQHVHPHLFRHQMLTFLTAN
jgi:site-specific recombinase XerD